VEASAVIQKFFAVVRGYDKHATVPKLPLLKRIDESLQLVINPANSRVIQLDQHLSVAVQALWAQVGTIPKGIQVQSLRRSYISIVHHAERLRGGIIGRVWVHQM